MYAETKPERMCSVLKWSHWIIHEHLRVMPFIIFRSKHVCLRHLFKLAFMIVQTRTRRTYTTRHTIKYSSINFIVPLYCYCSSNNLVTTSFMSNVTLLMFCNKHNCSYGTRREYTLEHLQWILFPFRHYIVCHYSRQRSSKCTRYMNTSGMLTSWHHNTTTTTLHIEQIH